MADGLQGVADVRRAFEEVTARAEQAVRKFVVDGAHLIERQAKTNATGRPGPNVRSGALRRSIVVDGPHPLGRGAWSARVGPTVVYSRAVELGHPRWAPGTRYPYLGPAHAFAVRAALPELWRKAMADAVKR